MAEIAEFDHEPQEEHRKVPRWRKVLKWLLIALAAIAVVACVAFGIYVSQYYHAAGEANSALQGSATVEVSKINGDDLAFVAPDSPYGVIFYPGAKVEYTAYAPLAHALAERGITCVVVSMPFNLAFFDIGAAKSIPAQFPEVEYWFMAGHSLGGSMAASYAAQNADALDGLVMLAAYSADDISSSDLAVLSIYGSNDGVLNREKYLGSRDNLPPLAAEYVIEGGNHALFGMYGAQDGDGIAAISNEEQINASADVIAGFIKASAQPSSASFGEGRQNG